VLDGSRRECRDMGVMADPQVTARHESLFQSQPALRQVFKYLQPQIILSSPLQLDGAHQFRYGLEHLHFPSG